MSEQPKTEISTYIPYEKLPISKRAWFRVVIVLLGHVFIMMRYPFYNYVYLNSFSDKMLFVHYVILIVCCIYIFRGECRTDLGRVIKLFTILVFMFLLVAVVIMHGIDIFLADIV